MSTTAANDRARRLQRLLKVQNQRRQVEEWRLAHLKEERARIEAHDVEIVESLNHEGALHGLFLDAKVSALRRNDVERRRVAAEEDRVEGRLREARRLEKGVEKAHGRAAREAREGRDRKALDETVDRVASLSFQAGVAARFGLSDAD